MTEHLFHETENLDRLKSHLASAASDCDMLATLPAQGPTYVRLRASLKDIEESCRQVAFHRGDARWLVLGIKMEEAHQRSRTWIDKNHPRKLFLMLAEVLRGMLYAATALETRATGRLGLILPKVGAGPARDRPVQVLLH